MARGARFVQQSAWSAFACAAVLAPCAPEARAANAYVFAIQPKTASEALIEFAVQANISIGGVNACHGLSAGLNGRYSIDDGLTRLLANTGCGFHRVAPDTVGVFVQPAAPLPARPVAQPRQGQPQTTPEPMAAVSPLVVTTTKRSALISTLPYAISAIGRDQLVEAGAKDIGDIAAQIPGLATTNLGLGRDKILLRGLSDGVFTGRTQSTVGIYLDDVPITYNAPDPDLQLADVRAVEVLRGPQGSLYGGGAMSGVYRIITRKPMFDAWAANARAGVSFTQQGALSQEFEGMLNAPLISDATAMRLVAYQTVEGGYIDATDLRLANVDKTTRTGARAALSAALGADWLVNATVGYQSIKANDAQYVTPGGGRLHRANQILETSQNNFTHAAVSAERAEPWGHFKSTTAYVQHRFSNRSDASTALPLFGLGAAAVGSYEEPINIQMLTEDAVLTSPNSGRLQWLAGLYGAATWEKTNSLVRAAGPDTTAQTLYSETRSDQRDVAALYGEASYALTDRVTATVGARLGRSTSQTKSDVRSPQLYGRRLYSGSSQGWGFTPKLALSYTLAANRTLYWLASEGGRGGGINTGGPIGTAFVTGDGPGVHRQFGSDRLYNFETGAKLTFFDGRLSVNADLFYDVWRNIQTDQFMASGLSYTANAGDGRNAGAEIEVVARPAAGWTVQGTALLNDPVLTHANAGFSKGVNLPGVPDVSLGGRTAYRWSVSETLTALVSAEAQYIGRSHLTFNANTSPSMGGYILARFSAQIQRRDWRLALFLSNPANARGNTFSYGNPFNFQQAQELTPERPRTLRVVLSKDF